MSARKSDDFISDVERQFEWYAVNAGRVDSRLNVTGWDIAELAN
jgi:hypothetical protein